MRVGTNKIGAPDLALGEDAGHTAAFVVIDADPVVDVCPGPVERVTAGGQDVGDLPCNELLHVLEGPVVVEVVRDGGPRAVGPYQHVGGRLSGRIGA